MTRILSALVFARGRLATIPPGFLGLEQALGLVGARQRRAAPWLPAALEKAAAHAVVLALVAVATFLARQSPGPAWSAGEPDVPLPIETESLAESAEPLFLPGLALPLSAPAPRLLVPDRDITTLSGAPAPASAPRESPPAARGGPIRYTVRPGDTLSGVAGRFGISVETLVGANSLADPDDLQIGDDLLILPVSGILHTVAPGDSVSDLAAAYGVSPGGIVDYNALSNPNSLVVGEKLMVPGGKLLMARAAASQGARPAPLAASGSLRWPAGGGITTYFGPGHRGIDLAAQHGNPIYAADGGVVVTDLKQNYDYGWYLVIDHGNGYQTLYAHLSAFDVGQGDRVAKGERIGAVGSTGLSTGPHLHFEVFQGGMRVNPLKLLP